MYGLLGGTFNPIHLGHLSIARDVLDSFNLSRIDFLPCHTPVHREDPKVKINTRLKMLELAIQDETSFYLNRTEVDRGGDSYMIDTLKTLKNRSEESILLILGTDAFNGLHHWKQAQDILKHCHVVVCQRPEEVCQQKFFQDKIIDDPSSLKKKTSGNIFFLEVNQVACSSTIIREKLAKHQSVSQYLSKPVVEFIHTNQLYKSKN